MTTLLQNFTVEIGGEATPIATVKYCNILISVDSSDSW
jgi:hypothetical protein